MSLADSLTVMFLVAFGGLQLLLLGLVLIRDTGGVGRRKMPAPVMDDKDAMTRG